MPTSATRLRIRSGSETGFPGMTVSPRFDNYSQTTIFHLHLNREAPVRHRRSAIAGCAGDGERPAQVGIEVFCNSG